MKSNSKINSSFKTLILLLFMLFTNFCTTVNELVPTEYKDVANADEYENITTGGCNNSCNNCVLYARCKVPKLPYNLTYYSSKKSIINTKVAAVGSVAIMPGTNSTYGHVAVVIAVFSNGKITIDEGNGAISGKCGTRTGYPTDWKVAGYFKP